jgi:large subunit ribosomal protein L10
MKKKQDKTATVEKLTDSFGRASIALVSEYRGMTAGESTELRRRLRAIRGEMRVAKNTLVRRAIKGTPYEALDQTLGGQVGVIVSYEDPVELAKTVTGLREFGDKLKLRGGVLEGKPITPEEIQALATMPPREVVMAQLLGLLNAPATRLVRLLNEPGSALARVIDAIGKKNGGGGAAPEPAAAPEAPAAPAADAPPAAAPPADDPPAA